MGSVGTVLSLDFKPTLATKSITEFLVAISAIGNVSEKAAKLDGFIKLLEEELKKIDAFKRELPYCLLLLNDAILVLKEELAQCVVRKCQPVLEEFIPLKKDDNGDGDGEDSSITTRNEKDSNSNNRDKKNWMSSVQLWNSDEDFHSTDQESKTKKNDDNLLQGCKEMGGVREFMPFKPYAGFSGKEKEKLELPAPDLTLLDPEIRVLSKDLESLAPKVTSKKAVSSSALIAQSSFRYEPQQLQLQTARKQRRCWSKELHRRFVDALEKLGGPQVATPKQIKELMQVDGLTNDEVKSHLQKYRLHARKSSKTTTHTSVLGGSQLMSQDQYDTDNSSKGNAFKSSSPESPLQLASNTKDDIMDDEEVANSQSWRSRHVHQPGKIAV